MTHARRVLLTLSLALIALPPAALAGAARPSVTIRDFAFGPRVLRIHPGSTVRIVNRDSVTHSFTSVSGRFDLARVRPGGGTGRIRFNHRGIYHYFCDFHPFMRGTVVVR